MQRNSTRRYRGSDDPQVCHVGPTAQDFMAAFGLGASERHIGTVDADGVVLAAIQGLYQVVQEKDAKIEALEARLSMLEEALQAERHRWDKLAGPLNSKNTVSSRPYRD